VQAVVLAPFEGVKVRQQAAGAPALPLAAVARAMAARGLLWRGMAATFLRDAPTFGVYFASFEASRSLWHEVCADGGGGARARGEPPMWVTLAGGGLAGMLSWALALPLDVIKSRVQSAPLDAPTPRVLAVARALYAEAGLAGFFKGALPCILRAVPVNAVTFLVYDKTLRLLKERRDV